VEKTVVVVVEVLEVDLVKIALVQFPSKSDLVVP
jgi:hypothetical protein